MQLCRQWLKGDLSPSITLQVSSRKGKEKEIINTDDQDVAVQSKKPGPSRQSKRKRSTQSDGERSDAGEHKLVLREPLGEYNSIKSIIFLN